MQRRHTQVDAVAAAQLTSLVNSLILAALRRLMVGNGALFS